MDDSLLAEGKLCCPNVKCNSRLGSFHWSGSQCSCGTWVTPSIKVTKSRVDVKVDVPSPVIASELLVQEESEEDKACRVEVDEGCV